MMLLIAFQENVGGSDLDPSIQRIGWMKPQWSMKQVLDLADAALFNCVQILAPGFSE